MKRAIYMLIIALAVILQACGEDERVSAPPLPFYDLSLPETAITDVRWDQGSQDAGYSPAASVYLFAWIDERNDVNQLRGEDIWGAILDEQLNVLNEFQIYEAVGRNINPAVAYDSVNDRFVVVWESYSGLVSSSSTIMSAIVDTSGNVLNTIAVPTGNVFKDAPSIREINSGFAILFRDTDVSTNVDVGERVLMVTLTDRDMNVTGSIPVTVGSENGINVFPVMPSFDCDGINCLIAYGMKKEILRDGSQHIYGVFLDTSTGILGNEFQISEFVIGKAASKTAPVVSYGNGSYIVSWTDYDSAQGGVSVDIRGRLIYPDGSMGNQMLISDFGGLAGFGQSTDIAYNPIEDRFIVVWQDSRTGTPVDSGIFARRIGPGGADAMCTLINNMVNGQRVPDVVLGPRGRAVISWSQSGVRDNGFFDSDVYAVIF